MQHPHANYCTECNFNYGADMAIIALSAFLHQALESWHKYPMRVAASSRQEEGLREHKRRETLQRISEVGLKLFLAKGYEETTLDEIAAQAGISRRTFFSYFKSKDEIILAYVARFSDGLKTEIEASAAVKSPLDCVRDAMMAVAGRYEKTELLTMSRFMRSRNIRGQHNLRCEEAIFEGLCEVWPAKSRRKRLRLVASISVGAMRTAVDLWLEQNGRRHLPGYFRETFNDLRTEIGAGER